jgi:transcriptional regulator with XRE-family HTH domain
MPRGAGHYARFLALLHDARIEAGLTQSEAAARLRRPQSFVSKCESGERRVDVVELAAFCRAYRIKAETFVRRLTHHLK